MRAGELARLSGVSGDSLRHYERLGILPKPPRTNGGYRNYSSSSLARVRLIRGVLSIGFSLPEWWRYSSCVMAASFLVMRSAASDKSVRPTRASTAQAVVPR